MKFEMLNTFVSIKQNFHFLAYHVECVESGMEITLSGRL